MSDADWWQAKERLGQLDAAIAREDPHALELIDSGMAHAGDSLEYFSYLARKANYYYCSPSPDSMLPYIDSTLAFCRRWPDGPRLRAIKAQALENQAAYMQLFRQDLDSVIVLHRRAYDLLLQSDLPGLVPTLCGNLADAYMLNGQPAEAATWFRRAILLGDSVQVGPEIQATLYMGLAHVYQNLDDFEQADRNYALAAEHYEQLDIGMKAYYLNNRGTYYYFLHDYARAEEQFLRQKQLLEDAGLSASFDMLICQINLADVYLNQGKYAEARTLVDAVEPVFAAYGVTDAVYYAHSIRIALAVASGQTSSVPALLASEDFPAPAEQGLVDIRNRYLRQYYLAIGDQHAAYENLQAETARNDSLSVRREHALAAETMMRLGQDTLRLRHQLALAEQASATREARTLVVILVGVLLLLLTLAAFWMSRTRRARLQAEMHIMQLRLQGVRQRISPHFIFNVLSRQQGKSNPDAEQELTKLAGLIRANLDVSRHALISLQEELDFVRYYVDVECGTDIALHISAPDEATCRRLKVPSMFVQILVENAVKHGLKGIEGAKTLDIDIQPQADAVLAIAVENNGRPFDIRAALGRSTGTGLTIIQETMALYNRRHPRSVQMQLDLATRSDGTGCRATLSLPQAITSIV